MHTLHDLLDSRLQSIGTNHFVILPQLYMSLMLLIVFPTVKQTRPCRDHVLLNVLYCSFLNTHLRKNIN